MRKTRTSHYNILRLLLALPLFTWGCTSSRLPSLETNVSVGKVEGRIVSRDSTRSTKNIRVGLAHTATQTVTDSSGTFMLRDIPYGRYILVAVLENREPLRREITVENKQVRLQTLELESSAPPLQNVAAGDSLSLLQAEIHRLKQTIEEKNILIRYLKDIQIPHRNEQFQLFRKLFVGTQTGVDIQNPEFIEFTRRKDDLQVTSDHWITIYNRWLGYRIDLWMDEVEIRERPSGYYMDSNILPLFRELQPSGREQAQQWERNRRQVYRGSLQHFLASLASNTSSQEGFKIFSGTQQLENHQLGSSYSSSIQDIPLDPLSIVRRMSDNRWQITRNEEMKIVYVNAVTDRPYRFAGTTLNERQVSWLFLNDGSVRINAQGNVWNGSYRTSGYWNSRPLSEMLPYGFSRPEKADPSSVRSISPK